MITDQIISITELKKDASTIIKSLKDDGNKIIFINNKPVAVLMDIEQFNVSIKSNYQGQAILGGEQVSAPHILEDSVQQDQQAIDRLKKF